ncbi:MAG: histidinol dehydrogenase, partial [Chloroflexi bacterium]|nr:histidinol dehydrogenase [Chloroflexota bacterium]
MIRRFGSAAVARESLLAQRTHAAFDPQTLPSAVRASIRENFGEDLSAEAVVQRIVRDVRTRGDEALRTYTRAFDGADIQQLKVTQAEIEAAVDRVGSHVMDALLAAEKRIRA